MIVDETYLEHFGVKGMRWGVRRDSHSSENDGKSKKHKMNPMYAALAGSLLIGVGAAYVSSPEGQKRMSDGYKKAKDYAKNIDSKRESEVFKRIREDLDAKADPYTRVKVARPTVLHK